MPVHLWGKTVPDTTDMLRAETDEEAKVSCIGPAGEKLVLFACVMNEMPSGCWPDWRGGSHGLQEPQGRGCER